MKQTTVNITKQAKINGKWQRYPVAMNKNGSIKPEYILVAGRPVHAGLGNYILDWYENGKRVRLSVGSDAADALAAKERKEAELKHVANGGSGLVNGATAKTEKTPLKDAIAAFLEKKKLEQRKKTYQAYRTALTYFQHSCHKMFIQDVDPLDLARFKKVLEDGGMQYTDYAGNKQVMKAQSQRSVYNKREVVTFLLREYHVTRPDGKPILRTADREKPSSNKHEAYSREEIEALFAACNEEEATWFKFFLMTGVREQEAAHLSWDAVDFRNRLIHIRDNLYGTTWGGDQGAGTVFKLTPNPDGSWTHQVLYSFAGGSDGYGPVWGGLAWDAAGSLYGGTVAGGLYRSGVLFKLTPNSDGTWSESIIHQFTGGKDGGFPETTPFFDTAGKLYAGASAGGVQGCGTVYEMTPGSNDQWTYRLIHQFRDRPACSPWAGLIPDAAGNLYGTTRNTVGECRNPPEECGTVFKLTSTPEGKWMFKVIHKFTGGKGGSDPSVSGLIFDDNGVLYGTTEHSGSYGSGVFFKLTPGSNDKWSYRVLHQFRPKRDGSLPSRRLIRDKAGNFFGIAVFGGAYGYGTLYKMAPNPDGTWTFSVLYNFAGSDGAYPSGSPILDDTGNFYGITGAGGIYGYGTVYEITP